MRLSELVSRLTPNELTQVALLLFLGVFVAVSVRAFLQGRAEHERAAALPLDDGEK
jgi:cbb3-type cytochrome oxidase subunit 3